MEAMGCRPAPTIRICGSPAPWTTLGRQRDDQRPPTSPRRIGGFPHSTQVWKQWTFAVIVESGPVSWSSPVPEAEVLRVVVVRKEVKATS